ncbi:TIGR02710 family CRISPR-associated protein [Candidatus Poribacteria bacterium]|nr:MAG: TIGR02710 family CRISPR-associated protein [Candidatus Poribacteria bacterium]
MERARNRGEEVDPKLLLEYRFPPELLADLIANAERRAGEGRYEDAVARLYRACEMIAQIGLASYGVDTSKLRPDDIPQDIKGLFPELEREGKVVAVGLDRGFKLLKAKGDDRASGYIENKRLQDLLSRRNRSILAHGTSPVGGEVYRELRDQILSLAEKFVPNISELLGKASFPRIRVIV